MTNLHNRIKQLENKTEPEPITPDKIIIYSDLPEGVKPTGVITITTVDNQQPETRTEISK